MSVEYIPTVALPYRFNQKEKLSRIKHMLMLVTTDDCMDPDRASEWVQEGNPQRCDDYFDNHPEGFVWMNDTALRELAAEIGIKDKRRRR